MTEHERIDTIKSRRRLARREQEPPYNTVFRKSLLPTRWLPAILWSVFLSLGTLVLIQWNAFATTMQGLGLYAGQAMRGGHLPYSEFFGTDGVLYYLLQGLGAASPAYLGFVFFHCLALVVAGGFFYKIAAYLSRSELVASQWLHWFYLSILAASFGGLYAVLLALPFICMGIWFLLLYVEQAVRDEAFITYGVGAALVFLIYPRALLLWVVAAVVLFVRHLTHRQVARGIYQFLASLFGFLLVVYAVGYYVFERQILGLAIQQTFLYPLQLNSSVGDLGERVGITLAVLLFTGCLKHVVAALFSLGRGQQSLVRVILLLTFLLQTVWVVGAIDFYWQQLLVLLPTGFVLGLLSIEEEDDGYSYLSRQWYLPAVIVLCIPLLPLSRYVIESELVSERATVAAYIQQHSRETDRIYSWDKSTQVYLASQRLAAAKHVTVEPYLSFAEEGGKLTYELTKNKARFIVVNKALPLEKSVQNLLTEQYQLVDSSTQQLALYEKND